MLGPMIKGREAELSPMLKEFSAGVAARPAHTGQSLLDTWIQRDVVRMQVFAQMREYPVLLCPVASIPAFRHGERSWQVEGKTVNYLDAWSYTEWFNLLGTPALSVPVGKSAEGLPIGVQIVARPWQEELVISVAAALEEQVGRYRHPNIVNSSAGVPPAVWRASGSPIGPAGGRRYFPSPLCGLLISCMTKRSLLLCACVALAAAAIFAAAPEGPHSKPDPSTEAARLNNLGAAYMNQQLFEKGLKAFQEAAALDPKLQIAFLNQGIALLNLARIDPAKGLLEAAGKNAPNDPHAWFSLGLLYKNSDNPQGSVDAFRRVTEIDPNDADSWYFLGAASAQLKQYPQAIEAFQHALKVNPLHASAEFGIARAYQQSGDAAQAREHLARFQHITQNKLGSPIGLAYGDQGKYSLVEEAVGAAEKALPPIPVRFVPVTESAGLASKPSSGPASDLASFLGPGACFLDYDGDGNPDLFLPDNGPLGGMALYHNLGNGRFEDVTKKAGLDPSVHAIGCTAGDYDNDGATDLAVSLNGRVLLLHNEKNGTFKDVTEAAAGIKERGTESRAHVRRLRS